MNCFSTKSSNKIPKQIPPGYDSKTLFPDYKVEKYPNSIKKKVKGKNIILSQKKLINENYSYSKIYPWIKIVSFKLTTDNDKKFFCIKIKNKNSKDKNKVIIFSNGESSNVCGMIPFLIDLSSYLRINILAYEYPEIDENINLQEKEEELLEITMSIITYTYSLPKYKSIILMGYSTGVYLNFKVVELLTNKSKTFTNKLKHIINISPMWCFQSSFSKKIFHNRKYANFITNIVKLVNLKLKISTFISHGVKDDQIGYMITMKICSRLNFVYEWYPKEGDHYNLILKNTYRRKLLQRLKKFLSVDNSIIAGDELDNSALSKITNEGIKVNITKDTNKDLDVSSGNFFFGSDKKNNTLSKINIINSSDENRTSANKAFKNKIKNESFSFLDRKESGFSFLDISLQKMKLNFGEDIDEIKDEELSDDDGNNNVGIESLYAKLKNDDDNKNEDFEDDEEEEKESVINNINIINNINMINNNCNNNKNLNDKDDGIIKIVSSIVKGKNEALNESINNKNEKGFLINDSFAVNSSNINTTNNGDKYTFEISFRKDDINKQ